MKQRICEIVNFLITENFHMDKHVEKSGRKKKGLGSYLKIKFVPVDIDYVRCDEISFMQIHMKV